MNAIFKYIETFLLTGYSLQNRLLKIAALREHLETLEADTRSAIVREQILDADWDDGKKTEDHGKLLDQIRKERESRYSCLVRSW